MALTCSDIGKLVHPYLDGEFSDEDRGALEQHTNECRACHDLVQYELRFKAALRAKLAPPRAPSDLRARMMGALDELDREAEHARPLRWAWLLPASAMTAAAAAIALFFLVPAGSATRTLAVASDTAASPSAIAVSPVSDSPNPFIPEHRVRAIPVTAGNRAQLQRELSREVGVSVRLPQFSQLQDSPMSLRLTSLRGRRAVQATYSLDSSDDLSMIIFDPAGVRLPATHKRSVGDLEVYCDSDRGFRSIAFVADGVGYALSSGTLDEDQLLKLAVELTR